MIRRTISVNDNVVVTSQVKERVKEKFWYVEEIEDLDEIVEFIFKLILGEDACKES